MEATNSAVEQTVAEGMVPEVVVIEETVVEVAEAEMPEPAITAEETKPAKPVRVCSKCGHPSGNSVGKIRYGRIVEEKGEDGTKKFVIAALCDPCAEAEKALPPEERKPVFKIGYLISQIGEMNAQAQAFDLARGYWERVSQELEIPEVRKTSGGKLACGVPGCWRCKDGLAAVEHFVVLKRDGVPTIVGICVGQAAALAKCGADTQLFVTKNFGEAKRQVEAEAKRAKAFEAAKAFWLAVDAGEATVEVRVEETADGDLVYKCGVPDCGCRKRGDTAVEYFTVLDGQADMPIAGVCRFQFAALKQSGANLFATGNGDEMGLLRCIKHRRWLLSRADNAARAAQGRPPRPPRPQDFDKVGGGLARLRSPKKVAEEREKKRETREEREKRREERRANLAAAIGNTKFGNGKKHKGGKGKGGNGGQKGGKKR